MNAITNPPVVPHPSFRPELTWLEQAVTWRRMSMWKTSEGLHYESDSPRQAGDVEVGYWPITQVSGVVFGIHRDIGRVLPPVSGDMDTTRVTGPETRGSYVEVGR